MKTIQAYLQLLASAILVSWASVSDAQEEWGYEYEGEIPAYIDSLQARLTYPLSLKEFLRSQASLSATDGQQIAQGQADAGILSLWKSTARAKVLECMGVCPPRADEWDVQVLAEEQRDGYRAQRVEFNLSRWYRVKAYLLIPDGYFAYLEKVKQLQQSPQGGRGRRRKVMLRCPQYPAVVLMHDHGANLFIGKEKVVRPFAVDTTIVRQADEWAEKLYGGQYMGDYLAQNGYVTIAIDMPLWAERARKEGADRGKYDIIAGNMMQLGVNLCAFTHYDDVATADFLASLPFVDNRRIGAAGLSIGSYRAWMLAALSDRVKATFCCCWISTTEAQLTRLYGRKENGGFANSIPGLRNYLDYPDIASLAAPNSMLFIAGKKDKLFPLPGVEKAFAKMHGVWEAAGVPDKLETYILDQGHECNKENQRMMLEFLNKALK